jgi:hypothetical protein
MRTAELPAAQGQLVSATINGRLCSYAISEVAGASARIRFWAGGAVGSATTTSLLQEISLAANGQVNWDAPDIVNQKQFVGGVYLELVSGTMPQGHVGWA